MTPTTRAEPNVLIVCLASTCMLVLSLVSGSTQAASIGGVVFDDRDRDGIFDGGEDGAFSAPGSTPTTWNTILPVVGSSGDSGAEILAYPNDPRIQRLAHAGLRLQAAAAER